MVTHQRLTEATGVKVCSRSARSPSARHQREHQRPVATVLAQGQRLEWHTQEELDAIAWKPITPSRKSLGFKCPTELFAPDAFDFRKLDAVLFALGTEAAQFF